MSKVLVFTPTFNEAQNIKLLIDQIKEVSQNSDIFAAIIFWSFLLIRNKSRLKPYEKYLPLPYLLGVIPGLIFYSETRFKICSEVLLIPLGLLAFQNIKKLMIPDSFRIESESN